MGVSTSPSTPTQSAISIVTPGAKRIKPQASAASYAGEPDDYHVARHLNGNFRFAEAKETPEAHGQAPPSGSAIRIRVKPASLPELGPSELMVRGKRAIATCLRLSRQQRSRVN